MEETYGVWLTFDELIAIEHALVFTENESMEAGAHDSAYGHIDAAIMNARGANDE